MDKLLAVGHAEGHIRLYVSHNNICIKHFQVLYYNSASQCEECYLGIIINIILI